MYLFVTKYTISLRSKLRYARCDKEVHDKKESNGVGFTYDANHVLPSQPTNPRDTAGYRNAGAVVRIIRDKKQTALCKDHTAVDNTYSIYHDERTNTALRGRGGSESS